MKNALYYDVKAAEAVLPVKPQSRGSLVPAWVLRFVKARDESPRATLGWDSSRRRV